MPVLSPLSKYADVVAPIVVDLHKLLVESLDLPTPFFSADPGLGQRYGLLSPRDLNRASNAEISLNCTFLASAAFESYWEVQAWGIATGLNLEHIAPQVQQAIAKRSVFGGFELTSNITIGNPRAPLRQPQGQDNHLWVVDVLAPCRVKLLIGKDPMCGHR